ELANYRKRERRAATNVAARYCRGLREAVLRDRQRANALLRRRVDRIADRRRDDGDRRLADAARRLAVGNDLHVERRRFVDAHDAIRVEVLLLHDAVLDRDLAPERGRETEDQAAADLLIDDAG